MGTHLRMQLRTQRDRQLGRTQPLPLARWSKSGGDKIYSPMQGCLLLELTWTPTRAPQALGKHWMALQQSATSSDMLLPSEQTRGNRNLNQRVWQGQDGGESWAAALGVRGRTGQGGSSPPCCPRPHDTHQGARRGCALQGERGPAVS